MTDPQKNQKNQNNQNNQNNPDNPGISNNSNDPPPSSDPGEATKPQAKRLFWAFIREYWKPFALAVISLAIVDALDVLPPLLIKWAIDALQKGGGEGASQALLEISGLYLLAAVVQGVFRYYWRKFFLGTSHVIAYDLRRKLYEHLQTLSFGYFNRNKTGELMSRLTNDVDEIRMMFGIGLLLMMDALFYFLSVPFIMLWLSPRLALYILLPMPLVPIFVTKVGRLIHEKSKMVQERIAQLSARAQENFSGIRIIKGFHKENEQIDGFNRTSQQLVEEKLSLAKIEAGFHPALEFIVGIGAFFLIIAGGQSVLSGDITIGSFIAFQSYLLKMVWPMTAVGLCINIHQRGMASLGRSAEVLNEKSEINSPPDSITDAPISGAIEVTNLSFTFPGAPTPCLDHLSFKIPAGNSLGLVGPIGCGKSTLLHLLLRLHDPPPGTVFLDGVDVRRYSLPALRRAFGYVPQDTFLFSDSIRENLAFGIAPDSSRNISEMEATWARAAQIEEEIEALPAKFESLLGERGVNLSGGQKQRVAIARALARDPKILLLDDATSSVDTDTEERILAALKTILRGRTAILVSHRLVTVQNADQILFMEGGRVLERGTHEELRALGGRYARLWEKQRLKRELETQEQPMATAESPT